MRSALGFLTPLPVGASAPDHRTLAWFPAVGLLVGLATGAAWWGAGEWWPPLVAAGLAVLADVVLTGALHVDGLADAADGLLPHLDGPDHRKAVMAAPDVGAFGVAAVAVVVLLRWSALASMAPDALLVAGLWATSRAVMGLALRRGPYVGGGLGAAFAGAPAWPLVAGLGAGGGLATLAGEVAGAVAVVAGAAGVVALGRRRLGGVTGDVLGAAGVVGETVGLLVASATW